jgi:hypothetical protein
MFFDDIKETYGSLFKPFKEKLKYIDPDYNEATDSFESKDINFFEKGSKTEELARKFNAASDTITTSLDKAFDFLMVPDEIERPEATGKFFPDVIQTLGYGFGKVGSTAIGGTALAGTKLMDALDTGVGFLMDVPKWEEGDNFNSYVSKIKQASDFAGEWVGEKYGLDPMATFGVTMMLGLLTPSPADIAKLSKSQKLAKSMGLDITKIETVPQYAIGKADIWTAKQSAKSFDFYNGLRKLNPDTKQSTKLFDAIDQRNTNPNLYKNLNIDEKKVVDDGVELVEYITNAKKELGILDNEWDSTSYLKTILENTDGTPVSESKLAMIKADTGKSISEVTSQSNNPFKRFSTGKTKERKYITAAERDVALAKYGVRTKRDYASAMTSYILESETVIRSTIFNKTLREVAGAKVREDFVEVYSPTKFNNFKQGVMADLSKTRKNILDDLRNKKLINKQQYDDLISGELRRAETRIVRERIESELDKSLNPNYDLIEADIDNFYGDFSDNLNYIRSGYKELATKEAKTVNAKLKEIATKDIEKAKEAAKLTVKREIQRISREINSATEKGLKDLGSVNAKATPLKGIFVGDKDYKAVKELLSTIETDNTLGMLNRLAQKLRATQATMDIFAVPQALRASISSNGIKGIANFVKAAFNKSPIKVTKEGFNIWNGDITVDDYVKASEFIRVYKPVDIDIDLWKKFKSTNREDLMKFEKQLSEKMGNAIEARKTIKDITEYTKKNLNNLESWQFEYVMVRSKIMAWKGMVEDFKKKFPNMSEREIHIAAGRAVDNNFGGQNFDKLLLQNPSLYSKQNQKIGRVAVFALDYLTSTARKIKGETIGAIKGTKIEKAINRKILAREIMFGLGTLQALSYVINGHSTFENDDPRQIFKVQMPIKDVKGNNYYLDVLGNMGNLFQFMNTPTRFLSGKSSGPMRTVGDLVGGKGLSFEAFNPIPFSQRTLAEYVLNKATGGKAKFGVPKSLSDASALQLAELLGAAGSFASDNTKIATMRAIVEDKSLVTFWKWFVGTPYTKPKRKSSGTGTGTLRTPSVRTPSVRTPSVRIPTMR